MAPHHGGPEPTPDDLDVPGLAGERTDLAWSRSALALGVAGAALLRRVWESVGTGNARAVVLALLGVGAATWVAALAWSHGAARTTMEGRRVADAAVLRRVTLGTLMFCLAALVLAVLPAGL
jgi:uncharacterized membrane protein YidH (DUF202 family)